MSSCSLFGLDYQDSYDYDDSEFNPNLGVSVMEYMKSKPEMFSSMLEAIDYADMENEYSNPNRTYILLTNKALSDDRYLPSQTIVSEVGSYFVNNKIKNPNYNPQDPTTGAEYMLAKSWKEYPQEQVKNFLMYHIMIGRHTWESAPTSTKDWVRTMAYDNSEKADTCLILFSVKNGTMLTGGTTMNFNNWTGIGNTQEEKKLTAPRKPSTGPLYSALICTDGVIHVFEDYLEAPQKEIIEYYDYKIK